MTPGGRPGELKNTGRAPGADARTTARPQQRRPAASDVGTCNGVGHRGRGRRGRGSMSTPDSARVVHGPVTAVAHVSSATPPGHRDTLT